MVLDDLGKDNFFWNDNLGAKDEAYWIRLHFQIWLID